MIGVPSTSMMCSSSLRSSSPIVCSDRKLMPMPAITACLMVSLLDISIEMRGVMRCSRKKSSIALRVPEPGSRTMKGKASSACTVTCSERSSGWSGGHTKTSGCAANGSALVAISFGGRPITARSISLPCSSASSCSRLPITCKRTSMPGCSSRKRASKRGMKYLAVLTRPMLSSPASTRLKRAIASSASFSVEIKRLA